jgi:exopolysaccharide biosynthesis polyprenyl glycosylphosphotransferase
MRAGAEGAPGRNMSSHAALAPRARTDSKRVDMAVVETDAVGLFDVPDLRSGGAGGERDSDGSTGVQDGLGDEVAPSQVAPRRLRSILQASDVVLASVSWLAALAISGLAFGASWVLIAGAGILTLLALGGARGLYLARVSSVRSLELAELLRVCAWASAAGTLAARSAVPDHTRSQLVLLLAVSFLGQLALLATGRSVYDDWLKQHRARGENCRRVVLIGFDHVLASLCRTLRDLPETGFRVVGYFGPELDLADGRDLPVRLGDYADAADWIAAGGASGAIVGSTALASSEAGVVVRDLLDADVHVHVSPGLAGIDYRRLRALPLAHEPLLYVERAGSAANRERVKRGIDLVFAPLMLLLLSPVLLVAMLAVKLADRGPVFFAQERVGRHGETFRMWKLRTMVVDADAHRDELEAQNARNGPLFKAVDDPRVTTVGRVLRVLSIDEVPQLFNVISGSMTLVGPRPALVSEVEEFDDDLLRRHDVVPGITGLWQVEARDNPNFGAYRRLDLFYVDNWSVTLDVVILVLTLHVVVIRAARSLGGRLSALAHRGHPMVATGTLDG